MPSLALLLICVAESELIAPEEKLFAWKNEAHKRNNIRKVHLFALDVQYGNILYDLEIQHWMVINLQMFQ